MAIEITARHEANDDGMQDYAKAKAQRLMDEFPGVENVHIVLDAERHRRIAECVVQGRRHVRLESIFESDDMKTSIDKVVHKIKTRLRRSLDKVQDHKSVKHRAKITDKTGVDE